MKRITTILLVLLSIQLGFSQTEITEDETNKNQFYLGLGVDPMQFTKGFSGDEIKGTQWLVELGAQDEYSRVSMFYERFDAIEYLTYGIQPSLIIPVSNVVHGTLGSEFSFIRRPRTVSSGIFSNDGEFVTYAAYAFNASANVSLIKDRLDLYVKGDMKRRPDLSNKDFQYETKVGVRVILN